MSRKPKAEIEPSELANPELGRDDKTEKLRAEIRHYFDNRLEGYGMDPLLKDILCAMLANPSLHRGNSLDDEAVIKMACRLRAKLVDEKLAEPVIPVAKS